MTYSGWEFNRPPTPPEKPEGLDKRPTIAQRIADMGVLPCDLEGVVLPAHPDIKGLKNN